MLRERELDDREIEIEVQAMPMGVEIMAPPGMEEMTQQLQGMFQSLGGGRTRVRKLKIKDALKLLVDEEASKIINEDELKVRAVENAEQNGIVFIDEIDKIARRQETAGADVSREGVQRDLLPLVEGCTVNTKYGTVKTDHVLFIASGAFHMSKPSDLIPELQGRLPIRVELEPLVVEDFVRILTEPDASLCRQYTALLATEGVEIKFAGSGRAAARGGGLRGERDKPRTSALAVCTPSWSGCWKRYPSTPQTAAAPASSSIATMSRATSANWSRPGLIAVHLVGRLRAHAPPNRNQVAHSIAACSMCGSMMDRISSCRSNTCGCSLRRPR